MSQSHTKKKYFHWSYLFGLFLGFSFLLFIFLFSLHPVFALDLGSTTLNGAAKSAGYYGATKTTFSSIIGLIIELVLSFVGVIFMILTVYAGYMWMTARGEETQVQKAQKIITSSVIGLIVIVVSYSITYYIVPIIISNLIS